MKKPIIVLLMGLVVVFAGAVVFAQDEHEGHQRGMAEEEQVEVAGEQERIAEEEGPVEVGNKICPISGEEIGGSMMGATYEYEGKIYNFCCAGCIDEFNKDPQKYIEKIEELQETNEREVDE